MYSIPTIFSSYKIFTYLSVYQKILVKFCLIINGSVMVLAFWFIGVGMAEMLVWLASVIINTKKYHVFAPMGRFQLESIYLYFPPSSQLLYLCFCPVGLSLL